VKNTSPVANSSYGIEPFHMYIYIKWSLSCYCWFHHTDACLLTLISLAWFAIITSPFTILPWFSDKCINKRQWNEHINRWNWSHDLSCLSSISHVFKTLFPETEPVQHFSVINDPYLINAPPPTKMNKFNKMLWVFITPLMVQCSQLFQMNTVKISKNCLF